MVATMQEMQEKSDCSMENMQANQQENIPNPEMPIKTEDDPLQDTASSLNATNAINKKLKNKDITMQVGIKIEKLKSMIRRTLVDCGTMKHLLKRVQPILAEPFALIHAIESKFASYSAEIETYSNTRGWLSAKVAANPRNAAKYRRHIGLLDKKSYHRQRSMICEMSDHWRSLRKIILEQQKVVAIPSIA